MCFCCEINAVDGYPLGVEGSGNESWGRGEGRGRVDVILILQPTDGAEVPLRVRSCKKQPFAVVFFHGK